MRSKIKARGWLFGSMAVIFDAERSCPAVQGCESTGCVHLGKLMYALSQLTAAGLACHHLHLPEHGSEC